MATKSKKGATAPSTDETLNPTIPQEESGQQNPTSENPTGDTSGETTPPTTDGKTGEETPTDTTPGAELNTEEETPKEDTPPTDTTTPPTDETTKVDTPPTDTTTPPTDDTTKVDTPPTDTTTPPTTETPEETATVRKVTIVFDKQCRDKDDKAKVYGKGDEAEFEYPRAKSIIERGLGHAKKEKR
jgi:hypothetical protein